MLDFLSLALMASSTPRTEPAPSPPLLVEGRVPDRSVVLQNHYCFGQKISLTLSSNLNSIRLDKARINAKKLTSAQLAEFNRHLTPITRGYANVYFECALQGGFLLEFTELGNQSLRVYFNGRTSIVAYHKSLKPVHRSGGSQ